ncbi:MAG: hypothetical protein ACLQJL_11440 [Roseiarcus sp.]
MNRRTKAYREEVKAYQNKMLEFGAALLRAVEAMPEAVMREFDHWEKTHLGKFDVGTTDWPGWKGYIETLDCSDEERSLLLFGIERLASAA